MSVVDLLLKNGAQQTLATEVGRVWGDGEEGGWERVGRGEEGRGGKGGS